MNDLIHFLFLIISACSEASFYFGVPEKTWADGTTTCLLSSKEEMNVRRFGFNSSVYTTGITKVWTGTKVKYSKWTAFIGCINGITAASLNSTGSKLSINDCLLKCSDNPAYSQFAVQNKECHCLKDNTTPVPTLTNCRQKCPNSATSLCSSGQSSMLFKFVTDLDITPDSTLIEDECLTAELVSNSFKNFKISECKMVFNFACSNTTYNFNKLDWYGYQEQCFKFDRSVLFGKNYVGSTVVSERIWTPVFRAHRLTTMGAPSDGELCLALKRIDASSYKYMVESCSDKYPLLCKNYGKRIHNVDDELVLFPRFISLPLSVVVAAGLFVLILVLTIITIASKLCKIIKKLKLASFTNLTARRDQTLYTPFSQNQESSVHRNDAIPTSTLLNQQMSSQDQGNGQHIDLHGYLVPSQNVCSRSDGQYEYVS